MKKKFSADKIVGILVMVALTILLTFKPRQAGINTINMKRIVKIGWSALGDFARLKKEM